MTAFFFGAFLFVLLLSAKYSFSRAMVQKSGRYWWLTSFLFLEFFVFFWLYTAIRIFEVETRYFLIGFLFTLVTALVFCVISFTSFKKENGNEKEGNDP